MLGVLLGFGIGFAGAILFAPEKKKEPPQWTPRSRDEAAPAGKNGLVGTIRERVNEAMGEAREARKQAEREMLDRYERTVGRKADN